MNLTRDIIRKHPGLKKLQRFITACTDAGLLTRQELVSMLPPLFLDIQETDMVLDMCAAPGSKTSQMLELVRTNAIDKSAVHMRGGVVANDADHKRAYMLTHQLQRIDTTGMLVINHEGQHIPTLRREPTGKPDEDLKFYFDKVLVDVPCTGDGAIRKLPLKWRGWSCRDGFSLHGVQIQLLERSVQLVKVGGLVVYSTCSLSPIENEAVVSEVLARANAESPGSLELIDIHTKFPGLIGRRGIFSWDVMVEKKELRDKKFEDSKTFKPEDLFHIMHTYNQEECDKFDIGIKESMFARSEKVLRDEQKIHYTMRLMPQDMNTGGFYVALLRKNKKVGFSKRNPQDGQMDADEDEIEEKNNQKVKLNDGQIAPAGHQKPEKKKPSRVPRDVKCEYYPFSEKNKELWKSIKEMYGLEESLASNLYINQEGNNRVFMVNDGIRDLLQLDKKSALKQINLGIRAFQRCKNKYRGNEVVFRITQEGIESLVHNFSNRKLRVSIDTLMYMVYHRNIKNSEIPAEQVEIKKISEDPTLGYFALVVHDKQGKDIELACAVKFATSICLMMSDESIQGLKIKYLKDFTDEPTKKPKQDNKKDDKSDDGEMKQEGGDN